MEKALFETPSGKPVIAVIGEVFSADEIVLMERAAEELNLTLDRPRYQIVIGADDSFAANGTRLADYTYRVKVQGDWVEDKDLNPFWERVEELKSE